MEAPTLERLRHSYGYDAPERSQTVNRVAYKAHSPFEAMERRGDIADHHLRAANKLTKHWMGAMGVHVGNGDGAPDPDAEYPQVYHGQQVALAKRQVLAHEWDGLIAMVEETADAEQIGRKWLGYSNPGVSRAVGKALIISGLERLAVHWQLKVP